jgi:hypothetical protein
MQQNLKHSYSERMQLVPAQLMALVDDVIAVFHTDACSGAVDLEARLVPGLASQHFGGQETLWTALKQAAQKSRGDNGNSERIHANRTWDRQQQDGFLGFLSAA